MRISDLFAPIAAGTYAFMLFFGLAMCVGALFGEDFSAHHRVGAFSLGLLFMSPAILVDAVLRAHRVDPAFVERITKGEHFALHPMLTEHKIVTAPYWVASNLSYPASLRWRARLGLLLGLLGLIGAIWAAVVMAIK